MRRASRVDANQADIVKAARKLGATVRIVSSLSDGGGDLILGVRGVNLLVEVKDGNRAPSERRLTPKEAEFHAAWRGQIAVVESVDDLVRLIQGAQ